MFVQFLAYELSKEIKKYSLKPKYLFENFTFQSKAYYYQFWLYLQKELNLMGSSRILKEFII